MTKKPRNYSNEFKAKVVLEVISGQRTPSEASRAHKVHMSVLCRWRNEFFKQAHRAFESKEGNNETSEQIAQLERMIGRLTMELEVAKKASQMWNLNEKTRMVNQLKEHYPIQVICDVIGYSRSRYYYHPNTEDKTQEEAAIKGAIMDIAGRYPIYGYRRITKQLHREGHNVNHKRVSRLMQQMGLLAKRQLRRKRTTNSVHGYKRYPNLVRTLAVVRPNQLWVADITHIRLREEFVYLAVLMDVFTRGIRGWHVDRTMEKSLTITALEKALLRYTPEIHHSDQGVQYAANDYVQMLEDNDVKISMAAVGKAYENGYAERLMRTIKEEEVDLSEYRNFREVNEQIEVFLEEVYMKKRIHSSLSYLTPSEFEEKWRYEQKNIQV
ncbi:MAG: IS3 family transposase [Acaryochloris sp. RU_4_1]|nr:IS3 family transposase [Acaryochloris sp. RU_4_1]